jgi:hypothetical protein
MMPIKRKSKGKIQITSRTRSAKGKIFRVGEVYEYYSIAERRSECGCNKGYIMYKVYETDYGSVPTTKAIIV